MGRIKNPVGLIVLAGVLGWCVSGHAQPSIPKDRIPSDISAELRQGIQRLYASDPAERARAASTLLNEAQQAAPAIPFLIAMFHDDTAMLHGDALLRRSLASSYATPFSYPNSPGQSAARALARITSRTGNLPIDELLAALKDKDWHVRANAIRALGEARDLTTLRVVEPLVDRLGDESSKVRAYAAQTLGLMKLEKLATKDSLMEGLVARLDDEDQTVRAEVARALGSTKDSRAVEPLIVALKDPNERSEVRKNAAEALGQIGSRRAVQPLVAALTDKDWQIRSAALSVAGLIKDYRVLRPLVLKALRDDEWRVRARAAGAAALLSELEDPDALKILLAALRDKQPNVRAQATSACAESKDPGVITPLATVLRADSNSYVRWHAANALGKLGDPRSIGALTAALKDENELVRTSSQRAIDGIQKAMRLRRT